ncbi:protein structure with unknown function [Amphritea atlantica]|uniref:Uncharacterized protein n=1 Tax=Amphritea atlantica TaxID=355243 RepID=A0A1H9JI56_9GAMM|nr:DUF4144 family protein [Amphritea atlantica]SEQ86469.1 protein structure with unknown function [Amphritea atlantica]
MVRWPAIIKYEGDSELTFVSGLSEWECDADLHFFSYEEGDALIDSEGVIYALDKREADCIKPRATGGSFNKEEILEIIKEHFSAIGECCVSKFSISTISEGVAVVGKFEEK